MSQSRQRQSRQFYPQNNPYTSKYFHTTQTGSIRQISHNSIEQPYLANPSSQKITSKHSINQSHSNIVLQHPNHVSSRIVPYNTIPMQKLNQQYTNQTPLLNISSLNGQSIHSQNQMNSVASVKFLEQKVECLQNQLLQLTQMLKDQGSNGQIAEKLSTQLASLNNSLRKQKINSSQLGQELQRQRNLNKMLRKQLQQSQQINQQLRASLTTMGDQLQSFGKEVQNSRQMMTNSRSDTHKMHEQIMAMTSKLQHMNTQYQLIEKQKETYRRQYEQETRLVQTLKHQISTLQQENYRFECQVQKYTEINQKDREHVEEIINQNQRQLILMSQELKWYKQKLQQVQQGHSNKNKQQVFSFSSQKNVVKSTVQWMPSVTVQSETHFNKKQVSENVPRDHSERQIGSEASQLENRRFKKQIESLSERQNKTKEKYKKIIEQLQIQKNDYMNEVYSLKSQIRRLQNLVKQKEFDVQQLKSKEKHSSSLWSEKQKYYQAQLGKRNEQIKYLSCELNDTTCEINQLKDQMSIISHSHQQSGNSDKISQLQFQANQKREEIRRNQQQKFLLEQELEKQRRKYSALKKQMQNGSVIQKQLEMLIIQIDDIKQSNQSLQQENKAMQKIINQHKRDLIPKYQREINLLTTNIIELQNKIQQITINSQCLRQSKDNHLIQNQMEAQKYQNLAQQYRIKQQQNEILSNKISQVHVLYEEKVRREKDYLQQIKNLKTNYEKTVRTFEQLKIIVSNLEQQKGFYAIDNSSLRSQVKSLEMQIIALQSQRLQLAKYNDQLKVQMRRVNNEQNHINSQHKKFIEKYEKLLSSEQEKQKLQSTAVDYYQNQIQHKICEISEFKNQIIALKKQALQKQHEYGRKRSQLEQQMQKLRVENHYHRTNIDKFFREGVLTTQNGTIVSQTQKSSFNLSKNAKQNLNEFSEMLTAQRNQKNSNYNFAIEEQQSAGDVHQSDFTKVAETSMKNDSNLGNRRNSNIVENFNLQYKNARNQQLRTETSQFRTQSQNQAIRQQQFKFPQFSAYRQKNLTNESSRNVNRIANKNNYQSNDMVYASQLEQQNEILRKRIQRANKDVAKLKRCIDEHLIENGITPRQESTCAIARAIWLVEIMSTNMKQYRTDIQTLKIQKREILTKTQKLQIKNQSLTFDNQRMLTQMQLMLEKMHYLQNSQKQNYEAHTGIAYSGKMGFFSFKDTNVDSMGSLKAKMQKSIYKRGSLERQSLKAPVQFTFGSADLQQGIKKSWVQKRNQIENGQQGYYQNLVQEKNNKLYKNKSASSLIGNSGFKKRKLKRSQGQDQDNWVENQLMENVKEVPRLKLQQQGSENGLKKISSINLTKYKEDRKKLLQLNNRDLMEMNEEDAIDGYERNRDDRSNSSPYSLSEDNCEDYINSNKNESKESINPQNKKRTKKFDKSKYINNYLRNAEFEQEHIDSQKYFS